MATIKSYNKRLELLRAERSSFMSQYKDLSDYHLGYRGRFLTTDRNKGHKRNTKQINNKSRMSSRILASGMMSGITSPARPWFKLGASDTSLNESAAVKHWLHQVQTILYNILSFSNAYNNLHSLYAELGVFGTGAIGMFENFNDVISCKTYTAGSYMIGLDQDDNVGVFYREYEKTVDYLIKQYGEENCSDVVKKLYRSGNTETWVKIIHAIELNDDRDNNSPLASDMKYRSVYYEADQKDKDGKILLRSGFKSFPIMAPRWDVAGEDIYATDCPGMVALPYAKSLQLGEKRMYQALDKISNPPLQGDSTLRNKVSKKILSGDEILWLDKNSEGIKSIYGNYKPDINAIMSVNDRVEQRIEEAFYEDLFLMLSNSDRRNITATEIAQKQEEKLLMLGPVLERLHSELLDPFVDRLFSIASDGGLLPEPPQELLDSELKIEYISVLAQAQRMVAVTGIDRLSAYTLNLAQVWPEARHKFDAMQSIDEYSESLGTNPRIVRPDDEVKAIIDAEKAAAQQAAMGEQMAQAADTARTASQAETDQGNVLDSLIKNAGLQ